MAAEHLGWVDDCKCIMWVTSQVDSNPSSHIETRLWVASQVDSNPSSHIETRLWILLRTNMLNLLQLHLCLEGTFTPQLLDATYYSHLQKHFHRHLFLQGGLKAGKH